MTCFRIYTFATLSLLLSVTLISCNGNDDFFNPRIPDDIDNIDNGGGAQRGLDGEITLYRVNGDNIEKIQDYQVSGADAAYQRNVALHQEIWGLVKKVVPPNYRQYMGEFLIFNGEESGTAGFVFPLTDDLSKWQMGIAINFSDDRQELMYTIIHEFGHILTLNNTQLNPDVSSGDCTNYHTGEGCSKSAAYINNLYKEYWADIWDEFQAIGDNASAHDAFYDKYRDRFVTNYAATNPGEDIAEVFATFVTRNDRPSGLSKAEEKLLQMYGENELIELRNYIRDSSAKSKQGLALLPAPGSWKRANTIGNHKSSHFHVHSH